MYRLRPAVLLIGGLFLLLPAAGRGQKLDDDDKTFLDDVRPLILPYERALFGKLEDKADRLVFQEIFWARRDPDLATPENELRQQYERDRATADRKYHVPGVASGSETDCGRFFILFGKPDQIEPGPLPSPWGAWWLNNVNPSRAPSSSNPGRVIWPLGSYDTGSVWIYKDQPGRALGVARLEIPFNSQCFSGDRLRAVLLERMAARKIVHPNIDYRVGKDGHLMRPADQLAGGTPNRD
jgi:GWxTD domain-containing protein